MPADEIRKRLEDGGLEVHHTWVGFDGTFTLEVGGLLTEWQKALGPTSSHVVGAVLAAIDAALEKHSSIEDIRSARYTIARDVCDRLYP